MRNKSINDKTSFERYTGHYMLLASHHFSCTRLRLLVLLSVLTTSTCLIDLSAQYSPGAQWKQRETEHFHIIYPDTLSDDAAALSMVLDEVFKSVSSDIPPKHRKKKWPLVLTDLSVVSNGYVRLMPRKSVWYSTPGEEFTSVSDWWMFLARHEGRHLAQFDAADQGFTRFLRVLFGDPGWGGGFVLGHPYWLLEGDPTYQETKLSSEGRGRDPLFTQEMALIATDDPEISYHRIANKSFVHHHPSVYHLGYELSAWIRQKYGDEAISRIYRYSARIGLPVLAIDIGMVKVTGKHPGEIFREMLQNLTAETLDLKKSISLTPAETVSKPNTSFTRYDTLLVDPGSSEGNVVFVRRITLKDPPKLVRLSSDGTEDEWIRFPSRGRISMVPYQSGYRLAWNSFRFNPRDSDISVSDITVVDLNKKGRILKRTYPVTGSRYLYPDLSPDGQLIAVAEAGRGNKNRLVILDAGSGTILEELPLDQSSAAFPSWSPSGDRIVFTVRSNSGRRIAEWEIGTPQLRWLTPLSWETVKNPVYSADGREVIYSSNAGGIESLWSVSIDTQEVYHVAQRWYSASLPVSSSNGQWIYFVEYSSSKGERIARVQYSKRSPFIRLPNVISEDTVPTVPDQTLRDPENSAEVIARGNIEHPETPYKLTSYAFNIHSWGLTIDTNNPSNLLLGVKSSDILKTLNWELGASYDTAEVSPGAYLTLSYTGIRPVLYFSNIWKYRNINASDPDHYISSKIGAFYAANLARNGLWEHFLIFNVSGGFVWFEEDPIYPLFTYTTEWYRYLTGSKQAFKPDFGWKVKGSYSHIPLHSNKADSLTGELILHLPGGFRNTFLQLRFGLERMTANFTSRLGGARGYSNQYTGLTLLASVDYEFSLINLDQPLGALLYIQRLRLGLHSDFKWTGDSDALLTNGPFVPQWSTGIALNIDLSAFNSFSGTSLGLDFNWLWQTQSLAFDITIQGLPLY